MKNNQSLIERTDIPRYGESIFEFLLGNIFTFSVQMFLVYIIVSNRIYIEKIK